MTAVTTLLDEVFAVLAGALSPAPAALGGRVVDAIGLPVGGAVVRAVVPGPFLGEPLARAVTGADGTFSLLPAAGAFPAAYELVVEAAGVTRRIAETRPLPLAMGDVRILLPLRLTGSVGDGGENRAVDVRRVQDRLLRLGRLTEADLADPREWVALDGPVVPGAPGPRTMAALADHLASRFGRRLPVTRVEAHGPTLAALADDGPAPRAALGLTRPVGLLPGVRRAVPANLAADVTAVQERLNQLGFLTLANFRAEQGSVANPTRANRPHTLDAIRTFDARMAAGSLQAIAQEGLNGRLLDDPWCWGRRPLRLSGSVGAGGRNRREDVERAQDRLVDLGLLTAAQRDGERAAFALVRPEAPIPDGMIPATIAALRTLRVQKLGEADPAGLVDPVDTALQRLNHPPRVELSGPLPAGEGWSAAVWEAIHPAGLRQLQDRLLLIGYLTQPEHDAEKVDPYGGGVKANALNYTRRALALAAPHAGPLAVQAAVGQGAANRPPDVHLLQDRLLALRFLSPEAHARERVAPVQEGNLGDTFRAITAVRQRVFALPAPQAGAPWSALPVIHP
ncbi:MAG TPA: hypothetical protein VM759_08895, partial [Longimicrobium sp.]|nr:hypothetical protein [Longimicrobium sp.]